MVANVEMTERVEQDDSAAHADSGQAAQERGPRWLARLTPARLTSRIVLLNIAGLIILVSGILYFNQFRQGLIDARWSLIDQFDQDGKLTDTAIEDRLAKQCERFAIFAAKLGANS